MTIHFHRHTDTHGEPIIACGSCFTEDEITTDYGSVDCPKCRRTITSRVRAVARDIKIGHHHLDELQEAAHLAGKLLRHYQAKRKRGEVSMAQRDYWKQRAEKIAHHILDITEGRTVDYATLLLPIEQCSFTQVKLKADFVLRIEKAPADISDTDLQLALDNAKQLAARCVDEGKPSMAREWQHAVTAVQQEMGRRCADVFRTTFTPDPHDDRYRDPFERRCIHCGVQGMEHYNGQCPQDDDAETEQKEAIA